jgi:hypothetical protein
MTPTITRAAFEAWLAPFPDETEVGTAQSPCSCPIANFLESLPTVNEAVVHERYYLILTKEVHSQWYYDEDRIPMPTWAKTFIEMVDGWTEDDSINAGTAREYLARIPDEAEVRS